MISDKSRILLNWAGEVSKSEPDLKCLVYLMHGSYQINYPKY